MYLETIDEKAFRSFLSNPAISVLDGNVLDKHHNSDFYRFVRVPLSDGEHSVEALFGQMCSNYPTSMQFMKRTPGSTLIFRKLIPNTASSLRAAAAKPEPQQTA